MREDKSRHLFGQERIEDFFFSLLTQRLDIGVLLYSHDLDPVRTEVFKITCQLQSRAVNIRFSDNDIFDRHLRCQIYQI